MRLAVLLLIAAACLYPQELSHATSPRTAHKVDPEYTKQALDAKVEGDIVLSAIVGMDGIPSDIKVVHGLGKGLDQKAVECLRQWRFTPGTNHGEPVSTRATIEMNFRLPKS